MVVEQSSDEKWMREAQVFTLPVRRRMSQSLQDAGSKRKRRNRKATERGNAMNGRRFRSAPMILRAASWTSISPGIGVLIWAVIGVRIQPGQIVVTWIPSGLTSARRPSSRALTPDLLAQ